MSDQDTQRPVYLFPHIGRTGGDTLLRTLFAHYSGAEYTHLGEAEKAWRVLRKIPSDSFSALRCLGGHGVYYGLHEYIPRKCSYVGLFRDPVERVISQYYAYKLIPDYGELHENIIKNNISLEQFAETNGNNQICYVLGVPHRMKRLPILGDLQEALDILEREFCLIGTNDLYDEYVFMLGKTLGWSEHRFWSRTRSNEKKPPRDKVSDSVRETIRSLNPLDYAIYNYAKDKFANRLGELSQEEKQELEHYKASRELYNNLLPMMPKELNKEVVTALLQKTPIKIALVSTEDGVLEGVSSLVHSIMSQIGRPLEMKEFLAIGGELNTVQYGAGDLEFLKNADQIIGVADYGGDYLLKRILKAQGISEDKLVFAFAV